MGPATITLLRGRLDGGGHFYFSIVTQWRQVVNAVNSWDLATLALPLTLACNLLVFHIVCVCISLRFAARFYLKSIEIRRKAVEYKLKSFEICLLSNGSGVRISSGSPKIAPETRSFRGFSFVLRTFLAFFFWGFLACL